MIGLLKGDTGSLHYGSLGKALTASGIDRSNVG